MKWLWNLILRLFGNSTKPNEKQEEIPTVIPVEEPKQEQKPMTENTTMSEKKYLITKEELLAKSDPIEKEYEPAFEEFYEKINTFRNKCGISMSPTSYFRSKARQIRIYKEKAQKKEFPFENGIYDESKVPLGSKHMTGYACDFYDANKKLAEWVLENIDWCRANGFYFENFGANIDTFKRDTKLDKTPTWLHVQIVPPKSGRVIFNP